MFSGSSRKDEGFGCIRHGPFLYRGSAHSGPMHAGRLPGDNLNRGHDLSRRFIRPVVMLLLAEQPQHGYELMGRLKEFGVVQAGMDPSLLYRMLKWLERTGLAESTLDDSGSGPARKVYSLTPEGMEVLDLWAVNLDETAEFLRQFRERYEKLGK